ncbi:MAG: hypothetical protein L0Z50_35630 [Verrucomicrobiales bacterium]|nr:hypothetical protein [Verrucomicrobiales bacterium]
MRFHRGVPLTVAAFLIAALATAQMQSAKEHFVRGKELIEANGADSMGATRHGLEKGMAEVRQAIDHGYEDQVAAYKLLAHAYNTLALVYAEPDSEEQKQIFLLQRQTLEKLLELKPDDPRIRAEYARVTKDTKAEIAAWRDILASDPNDPQTRYSLGMLLVYDSQADEGARHLKKAVELADPHWARIYGGNARNVLIEKGKRAEADEVLQLMRKKPKPE